MAYLTAWTFPTLHGADAAEYTLGQLAEAGSIAMEDAAVVSWAHGRKKPSSRRVRHGARSGALRGSALGLLVGSLFLVPVLGAAVGAAVGAMSRRKDDSAVDGAFVARVRESVTPGTSALFVLTTDPVGAEAEKELARHGGTQLSTEVDEAPG